VIWSIYKSKSEEKEGEENKRILGVTGELAETR